MGQGLSHRHDLARAARRWLGPSGAGDEPLQPLYLQPDRAVYLAPRAGVVVKVYAEADLLERDWRTTQLARSVGVPTADILGFDPGPPAVLALRRVVGQPLAVQQTAAARDAGAALARLHRLPVQPPFGAGHTRWDDHILGWAEEEFAGLSRRALIGGDRIARLRRYFAACGPELASRPIALLHGDLQTDHLLVDQRGERVLAFLDFADAQPGDPLWDVAVLTLRDSGLVGPVLAGYQGIPDDAATAALLELYRLLRHLGAISWFLDRGFDTLAREAIAAVAAFPLRGDP